MMSVKILLHVLLKYMCLTQVVTVSIPASPPKCRIGLQILLISVHGNGYKARGGRRKEKTEAERMRLHRQWWKALCGFVWEVH